MSGVGAEQTRWRRGRSENIRLSSSTVKVPRTSSVAPDATVVEEPVANAPEARICRVPALTSVTPE